MDEKLKKIIKERVEFLPKNVEEAINSLNWLEILENIGKKYLLNEEEINKLETETLLVLIGLEKGELYVKNIENEVEISQNEAEKISDEIEEKIFAPIYNVFIEKIKKGEKAKDSDFKQSLDFILSGGNYASFMEKKDEIVNTTPTSPLSGETIPPRPDKGEAGRGF